MASRGENPFLKPECGSRGDQEVSGGVLNVFTVSLEEERKVKKGSWKGDVMTEAEAGMMYSEDGGRGHKPTNTSKWPPKAEKARTLPSDHPKESALPTP